MTVFWETVSSDILTGIVLYAGELILRVVPLLVAAIFLAESARLWMGEERLRRLLAGKRPLGGRLRAAALGAVLPFCECGAFPMMLGLIRAGVPAGAVLTFFLVSPVVSMPAFLILLGIFGLPFALFYLFITSASAVAAGYLLQPFGDRHGMFKEGIAVNSTAAVESGVTSCGSTSGTPGIACCETASGPDSGSGPVKFRDALLPAWEHTKRLLKKILPYMAVVILVSALLRNLVPQDMIGQLIAGYAPYDIIVGALVGIPVYSGDCAMIALAAPLIGATGALGAGIAFIISGSGTSISGIIFMSSIFKRKFLFLYVFTVFCIALLVGYLVSVLPVLGII